MKSPFPYHASDSREQNDGLDLGVTRGGSWHSLIFRLRTSARGMKGSDFRDSDLGFRCATDFP